MRLLLAPLLAAVLSACASAPPPAARPRTLVLVEASGGSPEAEAFVSRFLSVLSDGGAGRVTDARLAGARLETLRDPASSDAARFRSAYPGDGYLGFDLPPCFFAGRAAGIRCTAVVTILSPEGAETARLDASGSSSSSAADANPESEATREAASKAAKKLLGILTR